MEKPMRLKKIPQTDSIRELAHFWDIHDLTDFEEELESVTESVFQWETLVRICLPKNEFKTIKEIAKSRGVKHTELIRQWVSEKVEAS